MEAGGRYVVPGGRSARSRYLYGAATLALRRQPEQPGLPFIGAKVRLDEVARELGVTRTALYRRWETQHDFWIDLSRFLVFELDYPQERRNLPWRTEPGPPLDLSLFPQVLEAFRVSIGAIQDRLNADLRVLVRASLLAYDDLPELAAVRQTMDRDRISDLARQLFTVVDGLGYRFTAPLDCFGAATALWSLADGVTVRAWRQPGLAGETITIDDGTGSKPWTPLAYCARALLMEATTWGRIDRAAPDGTDGPDIGHGPPAPPEWTSAQLEALNAARDLFLDRVDPARPSDATHEIAALSQVTTASVARECGVSRRSIYNVWDSSDALRLDLFGALLNAERRAVARRLHHIVDKNPEPTVRAAEAMASLVRPTTDLQLWVGHGRLAYLVDGRHPTIRALNDAGTRGMLDEFETAVSTLWPASQRPSGAALSDRQLGSLLSCLCDGAGRLGRVLPQAVTGQRPGAGLSALLDALVAHRPGAEDLERRRSAA